MNLVFFSPEDLNIIKDGPGERRRFLDSELCQLDGVYITELAGYNHIVNQRKPSSQRLLYEPRAEKYPGCLGYADGRLRKEDHREAGSLCGGA